MYKNLSYRELSEEEREEVDGFYYLLGKSIDDPIFYRRDGKLCVVNDRAERPHYYGDYGYFCLSCRTILPGEKGIGHVCGNRRYVVTIATREDGEALAKLRTLREQYEAEE